MELVAVDPQGRERWRTDFGALGSYPRTLEAGAGYVRLVGVNGLAREYTPDGQLKWEFVPRHWEAPRHAVQAGGAEAVCFPAAGHIQYGVTATGAVAWAKLNFAGYGSTRDVLDGADGTKILLGLSSVHAINADGTARWTYQAQTGNMLFSHALDPAGNLVLAGGRGLVLLDSGGKHRTIPVVGVTPQLKVYSIVALDGLIVMPSQATELKGFNHQGQPQWACSLPGELTGQLRPYADGVLAVCTIPGSIARLRQRAGLKPGAGLDRELLLVHVDATGKLRWRAALGRQEQRQTPLLHVDGARIFYLAAGPRLVAVEPPGAQ
jgi:hypothetical protein